MFDAFVKSHDQSPSFSSSLKGIADLFLQRLRGERGKGFIIICSAMRADPSSLGQGLPVAHRRFPLKNHVLIQGNTCDIYSGATQKGESAFGDSPKKSLVKIVKNLYGR